MRVLVTRAEPAASRTAACVGELGHEPVVLPLSRAVHDPAAARAALSRPHWAIAVTSAEAIRTLSETEGHTGPWRAKPLFAVGKATADAANMAGFESVTAGFGNGRDLADIIAAQMGNRDTSASPLLYLAGSPRASGFEARCDELRIPLETRECYRMEAVVPNLERQKRTLVDSLIDAVLLYSAESANRLFSLPVFKLEPKALSEARLLCLSAVVANSLPQDYATNAVIAKTPDEAGLLDLLGSAT